MRPFTICTAAELQKIGVGGKEKRPRRPFSVGLGCLGPQPLFMPRVTCTENSGPSTSFAVGAAKDQDEVVDSFSEDPPMELNVVGK